MGRLTLDQLQSQKEGFLSEVRGWSLDDMRWQASPGEWSAIEVLDHLVRTEVGILAIARRGVLRPHRIGVTDAARTRFLFMVFRSDRKVKVPSAASQVLPGSDLTLSVLERQWDDIRQELFRFLETAPPAGLNQGIFRHPVAGWMGMPQILDFFSVHMIHHRHQLARIQLAIERH